MQIIIPIVNRTIFFPKESYYFPKPLLDLFGEPLIKRVVSQYQKFFPSAQFIFILEQPERQKFDLSDMLKVLTGGACKILYRPGITAGALCSSLLAIDELDISKPLLISNSDLLLGLGNQNFSFPTWNDFDAITPVFERMHPQLCYMMPGEDYMALSFHEKQIVSNFALCGLYYFRNSGIFLSAAKKVILNGSQLNDLYYISDVLNELILMGSNIGYFKIDSSDVDLLFDEKSFSNAERKLTRMVVSNGQSN